MASLLEAVPGSILNAVGIRVVAVREKGKGRVAVGEGRNLTAVPQLLAARRRTACSACGHPMRVEFGP